MKERRYGVWAGNPLGLLEDDNNRIEEVWPTDRMNAWTSCQCHRKRGHGPDDKYCKQHAKVRNKDQMGGKWTSELVAPRCIYKIWSNYTSFVYQCKRRGGHGKDGKYRTEHVKRMEGR